MLVNYFRIFSMPGYTPSPGVPNPEASNCCDKAAEHPWVHPQNTKIPGVPPPPCCEYPAAHPGGHSILNVLRSSILHSGSLHNSGRASVSLTVTGSSCPKGAVDHTAERDGASLGSRQNLQQRLLAMKTNLPILSKMCCSLPVV